MNSSPRRHISRRLLAKSHNPSSGKNPITIISLTDSSKMYSSRESSQESYCYSFESRVTTPEQLHFSLGKTIGSGTYAKVKAAWSPYERKMIAIKILEKRSASEEVLTKFLPREMDTVQRLHHPNILAVHHIVETPRQVYFMLEMAENGDLLDYINACRVLPETEARYLLRGIAAGIAHCHSKDIVHRDLKCENIMITKNMEVKIGDFGFARSVGAGSTNVSTPCGSFSYAAPELLSAKPGSVYDGKKVDIWSMGCILFAMVCGSLPYGDDTRVVHMISQPLSFPMPLTTECRQLLVCGMLNSNVHERYDVTQLRISPWMRGPVHILTPYPCTKYQAVDCLPRPLLSSIDTASVCSQLLPVTQSFRPSHTQPTSLSCGCGHSRKTERQQTPTKALKGKISSAGKKLVKSILHHSSPSPRTEYS